MLIQNKQTSVSGLQFKSKQEIKEAFLYIKVERERKRKKDSLASTGKSLLAEYESHRKLEVMAESIVTVEVMHRATEVFFLKWCKIYP